MENMSLSDIAAVTRDNDDGTWGNGAWWIIVLFLFMFGNGWNRGGANGEPVTEAGLCNAMNFSDLENSVGRMNDQMQAQNMMIQRGLCENGFQQAQLANQTQMQIAQAANDTQSQLANCCCEIQRGIDQTNYNAAMNTASINRTTTEQTQKILDQLCTNRMADMQNQINQLQLQSALSGVVRYPNGYTYTAGNSPFCGCASGGCGTAF